MLNEPILMVSNGELLKDRKRTDTPQERLFTYLEFMVMACDDMIKSLESETKHTDQLYDKYEHQGTPLQSEMSWISEVLHPEVPQDKYIGSFITACLGKMEEEPSRFITFQEYVLWRFQKLKRVLDIRQRSLNRLLSLVNSRGT